MSHRPLPRHEERKIESLANAYGLTAQQTRAALNDYAVHASEEGLTDEEIVESYALEALKYELVAA